MARKLELLIPFIVEFNGVEVVLEETLLVPNLQRKIISVGKLIKCGWKVSLSQNNSVKCDLIHQRLAHAGDNAMRKMGYSVQKGFYEACTYAEHPKSSVKRRTVPDFKTSGPLDLILMDIIGPFEYSFGGSRYVLTIIDEFSRYSSVYILKNKSDVFVAF